MDNKAQSLISQFSNIDITNPLDEKFELTYDGTPFYLEAHQTMALPKPLADHFTKYLIDKLITDNEEETVKNDRGETVIANGAGLILRENLREKYGKMVRGEEHSPLGGNVAPKIGDQIKEALRGEDDNGFSGLNSPVSDPMEARRLELNETPWLDLKDLAKEYPWYDAKMNKVDTIELLLDEEKK